MDYFWFSGSQSKRNCYSLFRNVSRMGLADVYHRLYMFHTYINKRKDQNTMEQKWMFIFHQLRTLFTGNVCIVQDKNSRHTGPTIAQMYSLLKPSCRTVALRKLFGWQTGELQCHPQLKLYMYCAKKFRTVWT